MPNSRTSDPPDSGSPRGGHQVPRLSRRRTTSRGGRPDEQGLSASDRGVLRGFEAWLGQQEVIAAPSVDDEVAAFRGLLRVCGQLGVDPGDPDGLSELLAAVLDVGDGDDAEQLGATAAVLAVVADYVCFQLSTSEGDGTAWEPLLRLVQEVLAGLDPASYVLSQAVAEAEQLDSEERRVAFAATLIVAKVGDLLNWIGPGRQVAPSGGVRRVDIAAAAGMLNVSAVGVNGRRATEQPAELSEPGLFELDEPAAAPATIRAMSMGEVPVLPHWWEALHTAELLERAGTRVRPGPAAAAWLAEELPPEDIAMDVIGLVTAGILLDEAQRNFYFGDRVTALAIARVMQALSPDHPIELSTMSPFDDILAARTLRTLGYLEQVGVLEPSDDGSFTVPPALRGAVAHGLLLVLDGDAEPDEDEALN